MPDSRTCWWLEKGQNFKINFSSYILLHIVNVLCVGSMAQVSPDTHRICMAFSNFNIVQYTKKLNRFRHILKCYIK